MWQRFLAATIYSIYQLVGSITGVIIPPSGGPSSSSLVSMKRSIKKRGAKKKIVACAHSILMILSLLLQ
jgi:hypothetical protein